MMTYQFTLRAKGYYIVFNGNPVHLNKTLDTTIAFQLHPRLGGGTVRSVRTFIHDSDLQAFLIYLEEHIAHLQSDSWYASYRFVPVELGFEAQALAGDVDGDDGEFHLYFMINVGISSEDDANVYVGGGADIEVSEVRDFMRTVQSVIQELQHDDSM